MKYKLVFDSVGGILAEWVGEKARDLEYSLIFEAESLESAERIAEEVMAEHTLIEWHVEPVEEIHAPIN